MKTKTLVTVTVAGALFGWHTEAALAQDLDSAAPVVVKTDPEAGATNVPPGTYIVHITFSKEMMDQSWSWSTAWKDSAPEIIGRPNYSRDHRVCAAAVKLEPGKTYGWWLNSEKFHGFKDAAGHPAVPYLLTFSTSKKTGAPDLLPGQVNPATGLPVSAISAQPTEAMPGKIDPATGLPVRTKDFGAADLDSTWSPATAVGEGPDFQKVLNAAKSLAAEGSYQEALQHYLWYFEHTRHDAGQRGVRLSFALSDWLELGQHYPKAKQALVDIRDNDAKQLSQGSVDADLFQEVAGINQYLEEPDKTLELFQTIEKQDASAAGGCYFYVQDLLVRKGEYQKCLHYLGDPQSAFNRIHSNWDRLKKWEEQRAQHNEELKQRFQAMSKSNSAFARMPSLPEPPAYADKNFVNQTRQLIEILVGAGQKADAEKILSEARSVLEDEQLKPAITDAEAKLKK